MKIFIEIYSGLLPYLLCIPLGYFLKRKNVIAKRYIHKPLIFILIPLLLIDKVLETEFSSLIILSIMGFIVALIINIPASWVSKKYNGLDDPLLKSGYSFFNVLFFGIPTVMAVFDQDAVTTLICIYLGTGLYGYTFGYTMVAKSKFGTRKSIQEALKVPFIYAFVLAIVLKILNYEIPEAASPVLDVLGVVVSVAGMTILGMNITGVKFKGLDVSYFSKVLGARSLSAIVITAAVLAIEYFFVDGLSSQEREVFTLLPLFPTAATLTVFASMLGSEEKDSAIFVCLSMLLSLILVPLAALFYQ
ncbi:AEC family transporter [Autumnicola musiva]|uniref:AEC family transporter n=1 Tax=Autumnicola musiva TaxID=3075589 RepID=A0ABU3D997_9FLAO|nr:hypothetical protein [Zunongwangia sp. F117]MDT0678105.1 hypothetical protein [Zunongwangia sp. F117]